MIFCLEKSRKAIWNAHRLFTYERRLNSTNPPTPRNGGRYCSVGWKGTLGHSVLRVASPEMHPG